MRQRQQAPSQTVGKRPIILRHKHKRPTATLRFLFNNSNGDLLRFVCNEALLHTNGKDYKFSRHDIRQRLNGKDIHGEHFPLISSKCSSLADDTAGSKEEIAGISTILRQYTKWFCAPNPISSTQRVSTKSDVGVVNRQRRRRIEIANDSLRVTPVGIKKIFFDAVSRFELFCAAFFS